MLERRSALTAFLSDPNRTAPGSSPPENLAVTLHERRPVAILQISAFDASVNDAISRLAAAGFAVPPPNRFVGDDAKGVRAIGPGVWQVVGALDAIPTAARLRDALRGAATVADLSHARTVLRAGGRDAARALAKHCPLDLDPRGFPSGSATQTRFGHLGITLLRIDDAPTFELLVFRGYAEFVTGMLCDAATEFGVALR